MVPSPLDVTSGKVGKLNLVLSSLVVLLLLLRHEKSLSDSIADETVGLLSFLGYQAPQNSTAMGI